MQKIKSRRKLFLYGASGLGINMMNLIMGSYLCSALLPGGFNADDIGRWTYANTDLVITNLNIDLAITNPNVSNILFQTTFSLALWSLISFLAKVFDGLIDLPFASFTDRLKTRWGRRRPSLLIGLIPMTIAYLLFMVPLDLGATVLNTVWFGVLLFIFYAFYTLTMLTYYATFAEVCDTEQDMVFLSNAKSIFDVVYFSLSFALIPVFVSLGLNIRTVALIFLPLSLSMLIPFFLLKEKPTNVPDAEGARSVRSLTLRESLSCSFKNKTFIFWLTVSAVTNIGLQLFLTGINEVFSSAGLNMTVVMASSFAPVPLTILLYNKIVKNRGLGFGYRYSLTIFSVGMAVLYLCYRLSPLVSSLQLHLIALLGGLLISFSIGSFFSVTYTVPSHLAQREFERSGKSVSSMYFAVEGVFSAVSSGIAASWILVPLKGTTEATYISWLPIVVIATCVTAFVLSLFFPKTIALMGKKDT